MTIVRALHVVGAGIRPYIPAPPPAIVHEPEADKVQELETENLALSEAIATLRRSAEQKLLEAREEGRLEGAEAAVCDYAAQAAALAKTAETAGADFARCLSDIESVSTLIAHAALAKVFEQPERQGELVLSAIRRQIAQLRGQVVLGIHVSEADFPDKASINSAMRECGDMGLTVEPDLSAGCCLIKLKLGEIDIGLPSQWQSLSTLLLDAAVEAPRS